MQPLSFKLTMSSCIIFCVGVVIGIMIGEMEFFSMGGDSDECGTMLANSRRHRIVTSTVQSPQQTLRAMAATAVTSAAAQPPEPAASLAITTQAASPAPPAAPKASAIPDAPPRDLVEMPVDANGVVTFTNATMCHLTGPWGSKAADARAPATFTIPDATELAAAGVVPKRRSTHYLVGANYGGHCNVLLALGISHEMARLTGRGHFAMASHYNPVLELTWDLRAVNASADGMFFTTPRASRAGGFYESFGLVPSDAVCVIVSQAVGQKHNWHFLDNSIKAFVGPKCSKAGKIVVLDSVVDLLAQLRSPALDSFKLMWIDLPFFLRYDYRPFISRLYPTPKLLPLFDKYLAKHKLEAGKYVAVHRREMFCGRKHSGSCMWPISQVRADAKKYGYDATTLLFGGDPGDPGKLFRAFKADPNAHMSLPADYTATVNKDTHSDIQLPLYYGVVFDLWIFANAGYFAGVDHSSFSHVAKLLGGYRQSRRCNPGVNLHEFYFFDRRCYGLENAKPGRAYGEQGLT